MSWRADQIYTNPSEAVLEALLAVPGLRHRLFLVKNLRGVRSTDVRGKFPQLPPGGILVVSPVIYQTGYDSSPSDLDFFARYPFPKDEDWSKLAPGGLRFFADLAAATGKPFFHYDCQMWGGDIEKETGTVYLPDRRVHLTYPRDDVLGAGLAHLGLKLPGPYWDLHVCSFQWSAYWLQPADSTKEALSRTES